MPTRYLFYVIILVVAFLIIWIGKESFTQSGVGDLDLEFEETAFYRNENNTGPVVRIYAVYAADTLWNVLEQYGQFMPHTKYGNTKVYFFYPNKPFPKKINLIEPVFDQTFEKYCLAVYEKNGMGQVVVRGF